MLKKIIFSALFALILASCSDSDNGVTPPPGPPPPPPPELSEAVFTSFKFEKANNPSLSADIAGEITGDRITLFIPYIIDTDNLIPSFEGEFEKVEVGEEPQVSGTTAHDFDYKTVTYKLLGEDGQTETYTVTVVVVTGIPIVSITTEGHQPVVSDVDWVDGRVDITNTPGRESDYAGTTRIRGRGNATWTYEKKPYRFKLDTKSEILGMPSDKDWVLLAEYCDKSLMRSNYGFELARLMGMPWSSRSNFVEFFLNGSYEGTYLLCEHVKDAVDRADVTEGGFLIERDNYWDREPYYFATQTRDQHFTFKYPDTDDISGMEDPVVLEIKQFMNDFESVLYGGSFKDPETGYRSYIDVRNFADWYLVQEVVGNIDTNPYFVRENGSETLKMYPVWDFEWSLGLAAVGPGGWDTRPDAVSPVYELYWKGKNQLYFDRLFEDPYFVGIVKERWAVMQTKLPALLEHMDAMAEYIQYAQKKNFQRWDILNQRVSVGLVALGDWRKEVEYTKDFLKRRAAWLDGEIDRW